jgi:hypothetical protein
MNLSVATGSFSVDSNQSLIEKEEKTVGNPVPDLVPDPVADQEPGYYQAIHQQRGSGSL